MLDLIHEVEVQRQEMRLSQAEVAAQVGVSQGQYSKVVARKVPLTVKMSARMEKWLGQSGAIKAEGAQEIAIKCMELMHLIRRHLGSGVVLDADRRE